MKSLSAQQDCHLINDDVNDESHLDYVHWSISGRASLYGSFFASFLVWGLVSWNVYIFYANAKMNVPLLIALSIIYLISIIESIHCRVTQVLLCRTMKIIYSFGYEQTTIITCLNDSFNGRKVDKVINSNRNPENNDQRFYIQNIYGIECYHMERRTDTVSDGKGQSRQVTSIVKVTTHKNDRTVNFLTKTDMSGDIASYWKRSVVEKVIEINANYFTNTSHMRAENSKNGSCNKRLIAPKPVLVELIFGKGYGFDDSDIKSRYLTEKSAWKNNNRKDSRQAYMEEWTSYFDTSKKNLWLLFCVKNETEKITIFTFFSIFCYILCILFGLSCFYRVWFRRKCIYFPLKLLIKTSLKYL